MSAQCYAIFSSIRVKSEYGDLRASWRTHRALANKGACGSVSLEVEQPVVHGDLYVVVVMEPPPVGEFAAEAVVVALDAPVGISLKLVVAINVLESKL